MVSKGVLLQDVVWEKLDAIDGNTVYVGSRLLAPGKTLFPLLSLHRSNCTNAAYSMHVNRVNWLSVANVLCLNITCHYLEIQSQIPLQRTCS